MPSALFRRWLLLVFLAWPGLAAADLPAKLSVYAGNYPLAYFAERIGAAQATVHFPVPAGQDPAFWRPDGKTLAAMGRADLILLNGAGYEKWLVQATLPRWKLVDTSAAFKDRLIAEPNAVTHNHGGSGEHSHGGTAFTTWLDFAQASQQAAAIAQAFAAKRPEWKTLFEQRAATLQQDLATLDAGFQALAAAKPALPLLASHPVYQYWARRYGFPLHSVHWEPALPPAAAEWTALGQLAARDGAQRMLWEGEPLDDTSAKLQALGIAAVVFDPCSNRPASGDFLSAMRENLARLEIALLRNQPANRAE